MCMKRLLPRNLRKNLKQNIHQVHHNIKERNELQINQKFQRKKGLMKMCLINILGEQVLLVNADLLASVKWIRLENETENGGFGRADFCEFAYPITRKNVGELLGMGEEGNAGVVRETEAEDEIEDGQAVDENVEACDASAKIGAEKGQQIFFNLPPFEKTNEEIHNIAKTVDG